MIAARPTRQGYVDGLLELAEELPALVVLPFATTLAMFATARAADKFRNSIVYSRLNVKIAATHGGISTGGDGASHQACEDIAFARALPNLTVLVPGGPHHLCGRGRAAKWKKGGRVSRARKNHGAATGMRMNSRELTARVNLRRQRRPRFISDFALKIVRHLGTHTGQLSAVVDWF